MPVLAAPGDSPEEREALVRRARSQVAFYGSAAHYAHQFDDLGFEGTTVRLGSLMQAGDLEAMADTITDEMLEHFAVVCRWDEMADRLLDRYHATASRLVLYLVEDIVRNDPSALAKWGEVARAVARRLSSPAGGPPIDAACSERNTSDVLRNGGYHHGDV